ncbi:MAG: cation diffusion facilitator family transporter [Clostridia bacterium]|nr:cation diffusion facilitator family transporter [Clostridia bacterium]
MGISVNFLLAAVKIVLGLLVSSIAIVSEGANNAADALSSVLTFIGTKLAGKRPNPKHPFGYRRIEYLTGLVIALFILVTAIELLISSVRLIFHPEELNISYLAIVIIAVSALIKFFLGIYTIKMGKKAGSSALQAVGIESRNDSFASVITILTAVIFLISHFSLDAYAGILISALIIKAGYDILKETLSELIGRSGKIELADKLYQVIRSTDGIIDASDMMLHNYGPDTWSGSVNVEMNHKKTAGEIFQILHTLQMKIMHEYAVLMIFGIYAVDNDRDDVNAIREDIASFVEEQAHVKSFHAVYLEPQTKKIYCDLIVDYELNDWVALEKEFTDYMKQRYPHSEIGVTIETEYV